MLDAAAELFAEVGFDAATMEAIAERANTSIGSVYQFWENKKAIFIAVADRLLTREEELFARLLGEGAEATSWRELLHLVIDGWAELHMREPASRAVWSTNLHLHSDVADAALQLQSRITERTQALVAFYAPHLPTQRRLVIATAMVEAVTGLLFATFRYDAETASALIDEAKRMLTAYGESVLERS